jgi:(S)-ureidoglycine aminohydrolase
MPILSNYLSLFSRLRAPQRRGHTCLLRIILFAFTFPAAPALMAQTDTLTARVYTWDNLKPEKDSSRDRRQLLDGNTPDLAQLEIHASTLEPGKAPHPPHTHADMEELIIVKEGEIRATVKNKTKVLGPGSIAYAIPGDEHGVVNTGPGLATYYVLKFKSRAPMDPTRGLHAGGSFLVDWNGLIAKKNEKGQRRDVFDTPTTLFSKIDMHVTTLNPGEVSHAPHVHRQEEIILLRKGDVQMQIGDKFYKASAGDLIFLSSGVLHALRNTGPGPCEYYALQWQ